MKKLYCSFVIVSVALLALFTVSQSSTAQNRSKTTSEIESPKGLQTPHLTQTQSPDYILSQIIGSPLQKIYFGATISQKVPIYSTSNIYVTSSVNGIIPTIPGAYQTTDSKLLARETFETKLNSTCNPFLYSEYLGGGQSGNETTRSIADDSLIAYLFEPVWMSCTIPNRDANSGGQDTPINLAFEIPTAPLALPSAPQNLQASPGNGQNFLGWQAPTSNGGATITSYRVFRGTTSSNQQLVTSGGCANLSAVLACTDTGLTNGQIYYYIVSAVNSFGQGPPSSQVNATPTGATIPGAPRNLQTSPGNGQNFLGWQAPTSNGGATITSYRVFRGTTSSNQQLVTSGGCANLSSVLACTDTGLTNGQIYYYIISAINSVGQGPPSNQVNATPTGPTVPGAPRSLQASPDNGQNFLGWQTPTSNGGATITRYRVFRGTTSSNQQLVTSGGCANLGVIFACTDTGLTNGQIYYYTVSADNSVGTGAPSNQVNATPTGPTFPGAPQNLQTSPSNGQNFLGWQPPASNGGAPIIGYRVFRGTTSSNQMVVTSGGCANLGTVLACTDTGLTNGQTYYYFVSAYNSVNQGPPSNIVSATPTAPPVVFSINPGTPISSPGTQDVFVSGTNFKPNLTVDISSPGGGVTTLSGEQIQNVTETSFIIRATLSAPGSWSIKVKNPGNQESAAFPFTVSSGGTVPFISSINPISPIANGADQNVIVTGGNFQNGLRINATFPSGGIATLQGTGQIQNVTANSFTMRITLNTEGVWNIRVLNPDNSQSSQFTFNVQPSGPPPTGLPTSVLSPVIGPLRVTTSNQQIADGKWEFNQHKTGNHTSTGGISLSNDTFAWDANLYTPTNSNADAGKTVFATAAGQVVSYVGTPPGSGPGAVLIAHPNAANPVWFSGYLHMTNVRVTLNQVVDSTTVLGDIGRTGASNDNLHFVLYSGQNTRGNLRSFNTVINERSSNTPPTVSSINPSTVIQGDQPQSITINGANFAADSIVEVQPPNRPSFTVTPQSISALRNNSRITNFTSSTITVNVEFVVPLTYRFTVINRSTGAESSGTCPQSCVNVTAVSLRTPVILIPGILGSKIAKRNGNSYEELFPSLPDLGIFTSTHRQLKDNVVTSPTPISQRPVVATEILRSYFGLDYYGILIDWLTDRGYSEYIVNDSNGIPDPNKRTTNGCDTSQVGADLFVFPYDWRNSNAISAQDLRDYIGCIKKIRDPNNTDPNFKVDIIAHSMGGLVARRYILDGNHYVGKMVTLGTPWLGAPKSIPAFEDGSFGIVNAIISKPVLKEIAPL